MCQGSPRFRCRVVIVEGGCIILGLEIRKGGGKACIFSLAGLGKRGKWTAEAGRAALPLQSEHGSRNDYKLRPQTRIIHVVRAVEIGLCMISVGRPELNAKVIKCIVFPAVI
jgi:hypothetical protein